MLERVARLESDVAHIRSDVGEMKLDIRELRGQMAAANESIHTLRTETKTEFAKMKGTLLLAVAGNTIAWLLAMGGMLGVMAKGFGWL